MISRQQQLFGHGAANGGGHPPHRRGRDQPEPHPPNCWWGRGWAGPRTGGCGRPTAVEALGSFFQGPAQQLLAAPLPRNRRRRHPARRPCTGIKKVQSAAQAPGNDRFRILLNDSQYSYVGMLATQLNDMVNEGRLKEGSVCRLSDYLCNSIQDKKK